MLVDESGAVRERMLFDALEALRRGEFQPWVDMFGPAGVMEFPYAPPGMPRRLDGKAAIAAYMKDYPEHIGVERIVSRAAYHAGDVLVVEFTLDLLVRATGKRAQMRYVGILTFAGDEISVYRDYWDPLVALEAMGRGASSGSVEGSR